MIYEQRMISLSSCSAYVRLCWNTAWAVASYRLNDTKTNQRDLCEPLVYNLPTFTEFLDSFIWWFQGLIIVVWMGSLFCCLKAFFLWCKVRCLVVKRSSFSWTRMAIVKLFEDHVLFGCSKSFFFFFFVRDLLGCSKTIIWFAESPHFTVRRSFLYVWSRDGSHGSPGTPLYNSRKLISLSIKIFTGPKKLMISCSSVVLVCDSLHCGNTEVTQSRKEC